MRSLGNYGPNPSTKALPPVAGTARKRHAPYLKR